MAHSYLALSITETRPGTGEFNVIAMDVSSFQLFPIRLKKEEIINGDEQIVWDIGKTTIAENVYLESNTNGNAVYRVGGCRLSDEKVDLKGILEENLSDINEFISSPKMRFAIVKVSGVLNIRIEKKSDDARPKCRMLVSFGKNSYTLLNKDYRWVNYWLWKDAQCGEEQLAEDRNRYLQLLNRRGKTLYLILYRHFFSDHSTTWIAGMHWI